MNFVRLVVSARTVGSAVICILLAGCGSGSGSGTPPPVPGATGLQKVNHVIVMMQENHSFDNYLGALPYAPGSPYHPGPCVAGDNKCVDGLTCTASGGSLVCSNSNPETDGSPAVSAFHDPRLCEPSDLDHTWTGTHFEINLTDPNNSLNGSMNGFVAYNDLTSENDSGESPTEDDTIGFYTQADLPFYYSLARTFALDDRYFSSVPAATVPNRMYLYAATSFGHLVTSVGEAVPPLGGYKPINKTLLDELDDHGVSWGEYIDTNGPTELGIAYGGLFRTPAPPHFQNIDDFMSQAASGNLPSVAFVDFSLFNSEHPPNDIRAGENRVASIIDAVRKSPNWKDSIIFWTYDEHGGFYDHVVPPAATPPDSIPPGKCADASNPPGSETPGNGAKCSDSQAEQANLCSHTLAGEPCVSSFNQYGVRVPLVAISPFSKTAYVSHTVADHTSIVALIEKRYLSGAHLTARDGAANDLEDMFDFANAPSKDATVDATLSPPASSSDPGCS
jgi:phospholipase C